MPASQVGVNSRPRPKTPAATTTDDHVLLFRACKYGNNKHKKKFSTAVSAFLPSSAYNRGAGNSRGMALSLSLSL